MLMGYNPHRWGMYDQDDGCTSDPPSRPAGKFDGVIGCGLFLVAFGVIFLLFWLCR